MQRNLRRGEVVLSGGSSRPSQHDPTPRFITEFTPRFLPVTAAAPSTPRPRSPKSTPPPATSTSASSTSSSSAVLDRILRAVRVGHHDRALASYELHLPTLLSPSPDSSLSHSEVAYVYRMMADCHRALGQYQQAEAVLLSALHHCEEAILLLPPSAPHSVRHPLLLDQQAVHHLLGDTYTALSEKCDESTEFEEAKRLALEALELACKAEEEATALLAECRGAEEEREVKEALLSAEINVAVVYERLITLSKPATSLPPPLTSSSSPLPDPDALDSSSHYLRVAKRRLRGAYRAAVSFALHQYQFLCQWHLMLVEEKGGVKGEAVKHVREGLQVFERCRAEGKSKELEWKEAEWKKEEMSCLKYGAALVWDMEDEGEMADEVGSSRRELLVEAFGWIDRVRRQIKAGEVEVEEEERRRVVQLFNDLRKRTREVESGVVSGGGPLQEQLKLNAKQGRNQGGKTAMSAAPQKRRKVVLEEEEGR